jgi:hypothetical protein|nr:MAG TPA: tail sheath protein [Caudoviricetes sp.]
MALGNVFMKDTDGNIGSSIVNETEKVCGLLFDISEQPDFWTKGPGVDIAENWKDTVVELNSLDDAVKLGITPYTGETSTEEGEPDSDGAVSKDLLYGIPYYHINQFFGMAGGSGRLFVMFADCSSDWNALIDMQKASGGIINQFGVWTEQKIWKKMDPEAQQYSIAIVGDLQSVAEEMANDYFAPAHIILSGNSSKVTTDSGTDDNIVFSEIADAIINARYVTVLLGQSMDTEVKAMQASLKSTTPVGVVGLALGALTRASVGESIGWVQNFDLVNYVPSIEMGFGDSKVEDGKIANATSYSALTKYQLDELDDKGYMFLRTYEGREGHVYFTKDRTCSDGDYCTIARNRTINKSRRLVREALLPYVNSPVKVDPSTGQLSSAQITIYNNLITSVLSAMETAEEISGIGTVSVPADQNILVNKKLTFSYKLIPLGCAESIEVTEGLAISR